MREAVYMCDCMVSIGSIQGLHKHLVNFSDLTVIFWTFLSVLGFFGPFKMGDFSFWYFWGMELEKKVKKSHPHPQKRLEFSFGLNWLNFC